MVLHGVPSLGKRLLPAAGAFALAALGLMYYTESGSRPVTLLACGGILWALARGNLRRLKSLASLCLLGYCAFAMFSVFWAVSGKFFLREYSKIAVAAFFFLATALWPRREGARFSFRVAAALSLTAALVALISVEAGSTGVLRGLLYRLDAMRGVSIGYNVSPTHGGRLYGLFGNPNIEASVYAVGILCSAVLSGNASARSVRAIWSAALSFCVYAFLLAVSLGAMACLAAAAAVVLAAAGKRRAALLLRLLGAGLPALVCSMAVSRAVNSGGSMLLPPLLMILSALVSVVLELAILPGLAARAAGRPALLRVLLLGVPGLAALYAACGLVLTGAYTFGGDLERDAVLPPGRHTVSVTAEGMVETRVYSRGILDVVNMTSTPIGEGNGSVLDFTVPEDSRIVLFHFSGAPGSVLREAVVDGGEKLPLNYPLLPSSVASRLQNLRFSTSGTMRMVQAEDAWKLIRGAPLAGRGVGAYESCLPSVQDFFYETKYVHNHYLQVLVETGVVGAALFLAALAGLGRMLWARRRTAAESAPLYPALCGVFTMTVLQMLWDISMSFGLYLWMAFSIFGLIVRTSGGESEGTYRVPTRLRILPLALAGAFAFSLLLNLFAGYLRDREAVSEEDYFQKLRLSAELDLYEHSDSMLTYLAAVDLGRRSDYLPQADAYAERLMTYHSNSIPLYLTSYYMNTIRTGLAIDAAIRGAECCPSVPSVWNGLCRVLKTGLLDTGTRSPLFYRTEKLAEKLDSFCAVRREYESRALAPLVLDETGEAFFRAAETLSTARGDPERLAETLREMLGSR